MSGPLLDRIDIHVEAPSISVTELREARPAESSHAIRARTVAARQVQQERFKGTSIRNNARMSHRLMRQHCNLTKDQGDLLQHAMERLNLSARAYDRILRVARTIADLAGARSIETAHLLEAIQYRSLDRNSPA